jgi:hypothetical protein
MSEEQLDRFARGELSPVESRELARKALDNPELFEDLMDTAVARRGLQDLPPKTTRPRFRLLWVGAAAAVLLVGVYFWRVPPSVPMRVAVAPTAGPPVFVGRGGEAGTVFRGVESDSRSPRATGAVTSIADGTVSIDLGSLDGLGKSSEVDAVRDGREIGKITLTTIFRERARGQAAPGVALRRGDEVRVPAEAQVRVALDQIAESAARGDADGARKVAVRAPAASAFPTAGADSEDLNNLGAMAELQGDRSKAQSLYESALRANPRPDARRAIETNLSRVKGAK